jgi:hypothetical protein
MRNLAKDASAVALDESLRQGKNLSQSQPSKSRRQNPPSRLRASGRRVVAVAREESPVARQQR